MALEVNREEPSAFSLSMTMKQSQGVRALISRKQGTDQDDLNIVNASVWQNKKQKKAGGINPGPAYRYRLINRKGFKACEVSTQKQHCSIEL